jgi:hypothetical protein
MKQRNCRGVGNKFTWNAADQSWRGKDRGKILESEVPNRRGPVLNSS